MNKTEPDIMADKLHLHKIIKVNHKHLSSSDRSTSKIDGRNPANGSEFYSIGGLR